MSVVNAVNYCPDPKTLPAGASAAERAVYYQHAHYIRYYFIGIGLTAALAILVFALVTERRRQLV